MKRFLASLSLAAVLLCAGLARASCGHFTATSTATTIIPSGDISPGGRHALCVNNSGASNNVNVQIGAAAVAADFLLLPTGANTHTQNELCLTAQQNALVPNGIVSVMSTSGTTVSWCDW